MRVRERRAGETTMNMITYLRLRAFGRDTKGQDLLEYALLVALIAVICVGAVYAAGGEVKQTFEDIVAKLNNPGA
jgi:pilus assembly protein Flp/PilA